MENGPQDASGRFLKQLWRQLCAQDQAGLEALLAPDAQINLVLPGRRWKAHGGANAAKKLLLLLKSSRIRPVLSSYYMERPFLAQGIFQMVGGISVLKDGFPYEICFAATVVESQGSWKLLFLFGEIQARQGTCKQSNELKKMLMKKNIALEKANQELGVLAANLPGGVITVYADDCFTLKYANQGYFRLLGYTRKQMAQELENKTLRLVAGPMQSKVEKSVRRQLAEGETVEEELCLLRRDGTEIWAMQRGRLMADEAGLQVICCMVVDITQSKKAREALAISEERYRVVSEQGRDVVFEYDLKTGQVYISGQFEKKFGYPPLLEELKNTAKIHQQDKDAFLHFADQIRNGKRPQDIKARIWSAQDSYVWCRLEAAVIYDGEGRLARAIGASATLTKWYRRRTA